MWKSISRLIVLCATGWLLFSCSGQVTPSLPDLGEFGLPSAPTPPIPTPPLAPAAEVERLELYSVETFPVKLNAIINGTLPGCTEVDQLLETLSGAVITLNLVLTPPSATACELPRHPFEMIIPLNVKDLAADAYLVDVAGKQAVFELLVDNGVRKPVWDR